MPVQKATADNPPADTAHTGGEKLHLFRGRNKTFPCGNEADGYLLCFLLEAKGAARNYCAAVLGIALGIVKGGLDSPYKGL